MAGPPKPLEMLKQPNPATSRMVWLSGSDPQPKDRAARAAQLTCAGFLGGRREEEPRQSQKARTHGDTESGPDAREKARRYISRGGEGEGALLTQTPIYKTQQPPN